jgi:hypothetical protein
MSEIVPRPASTVKAKIVRGLVQSFLTVGAMALAGWAQKSPAYGAAVPLVLNPLGGWLRDKLPAAYRSAVPF